MKTDFFTYYPNITIPANLPQYISGFCNDTRNLIPGECFLALTGSRDGHQFLKNAEILGASCAVVSKKNEALKIPQIVVDNVLDFAKWAVKIHREHCKIISVTGSYGKTSTKNILQLIFGNQAQATPKNYNNLLGVILTVSHLKERGMGIVEAGIDHPREMEPIAEILHPNLSITTGISSVHLANFSNFSELVAEKAKMAESALNSNGKIILPENVLQWKEFQKMQSVAWKISETKKTDDRSVIFQKKETANGIRVSIQHSIFSGEEFFLPMMSQGQVENFVLAATAARLYGIPETDIQERILQWKPEKMRGEEKYWNEIPLYLDCYNANPVAMRDAIAFFHQKYPQRPKKIYVLGGMRELGPISETEHQALGEWFLREISRHDITTANLFLIGEEMVPFYEEINKNRFILAKTVNIQADFFQNTTDICSAILCTINPKNRDQYAIFCKGSRSFALENIWDLPSNLLTK